MAKLRAQGFTLIEIVLVVAISSAMFIIIFIGQQQLRSRAQFDATVTKLVQTVAEARGEAAAAVNTSMSATSGTGTDNTPGCPAGDYVFAGTAWSADSSASANAVFTVDSYKAQIDKSSDPQGVPTGTACKFDSRQLTMPSSVSVNISAASSNLRGGRVLFVRTGRGDLVSCEMNDLGAAVNGSFASGACMVPAVAIPVPPPGWQLSITDTDGHSAQVLIDASGLAKRLN